ncbi:hypothetical protein [Actinomadura sp. WAC 06369]|uniref:hypothetical protein n=1 Tax=Actinomadura sp. WAC 06369 TaxID=2203193 RepID=UPI000F7B3F0D|nr:hypothetical protein [Actinomadura sp. WAC 06369]
MSEAMQQRKRGRRPRAALAVAALGATASWGAPAVPAAAAPPDTGAYLGVWNYDQPDRRTMRNIAEISCLPAEPDCDSFIPGVPAGEPVQIPQIGRVVFRKGAGPGEVVGRTDRGCTWSFEVRGRALELAPPGQRCTNKVIDSDYTLLSWSVRVSGRHERETIKGISHHEEDYAFTLANGSRTRDGAEPWPRAARRFGGRWTYDPADPSRMINMVVHRGPDGPRRSERQGRVDMVVLPDRTIAARTPDGCRWTLAASGNTAELAPPGQTCTRAGESVTLDFWQVASDGRRQASIMKGSVRRDGRTSAFLLNVGALTRLAARSRAGADPDGENVPAETGHKEGLRRR